MPALAPVEMPPELEWVAGTVPLLGDEFEGEFDLELVVGNVKSGVKWAPAKAISASLMFVSMVTLFGLRTLEERMLMVEQGGARGEGRKDLPINGVYHSTTEDPVWCPHNASIIDKCKAVGTEDGYSCSLHRLVKPAWRRVLVDL